MREQEVFNSNHQPGSNFRKLCCILIAGLWVTFITINIQAQEPGSFGKIEALGLINLQGEVPVYYSEGYSERAVYFQDLVESAADYFQQPEVLGTRLDLHLVILSPEDWAGYTQFPYGIAHILPDPPTAILAASGDNALTKSILGREDQMSEVSLSLLEELGISYGDAVVTFVDLIGFHEMGHLYAHHHGSHTWPGQKWLSEFVATYLAYAYMNDNQPNMARIWTTINHILGSAHVEYTSLAEFEELYLDVGNDNYGWYQARFQQKVMEIYEQEGIAFVNALKKSLANNPEPAQDDPFRLKELDAICEGFTTWAKGTDGDLK